MTGSALRAAGVLGLGVLAACSSGGGLPKVASTVPPTIVSTPTSVPRTTTTTTRPAPKPVVLAFGGDVHFEGVLRSKLAADPESVLAPIAPILSRADLALVNLETAITERGSPQPKEFTFRAPASAFTALRAGGIDVATMANNHGVDYGPEGLVDSLAAIHGTGFPVVGIGANASAAYAAYRATIHGGRIAIIGATQVLDDALIPAWTATPTHAGLASAKNVDRLVAAVRAVRRSSDTVVVFLHWGLEGATCPTAIQQTLAHQLVAAGADVIVGSHAHRVIGGGRLGNAFVDYGLGNFAFGASGGPGAQTGVLLVTVTGRHVNGYQWRPARISGGVPQPLSGAAAAAEVSAWDARRSCTGLRP